uniref:Small ribosomal subunit protein uS11c n=1 Tax=Phanera cardinalis TaxID=3078825 RepID=A0AAT9ZWA5_9FABA
MAKPIRKVSSLGSRRIGSRRIGSRRIGRISSRKNVRKILKGVIHIQASFNNTIVTVTDVRGRVISWSSAGTCGFKGPRKGTPFAAQTAAGDAIRPVADQGMQRVGVMIKGPGLGRDAALRAIRRSGILFNFIRDITPMPHNGCRPPKKRRV